MTSTDKTDSKKKLLLEALEKSLGVVSTACESAGVSRDTHYRWLKEDEKYKATVEELDNVALDFAESQLYGNIRKGDTTAIIFFLKTRGKKRGYIERQEIDHTTQGDKINKLEISVTSPTYAYELKQLLNAND
jgi:hypothetical protein